MELLKTLLRAQAGSVRAFGQDDYSRRERRQGEEEVFFFGKIYLRRS